MLFVEVMLIIWRTVACILISFFNTLISRNLNFMNSIYNIKFLEHADCYYELENSDLHK